MPTIFATDPTARFAISGYGIVTETQGVEVPESVAVELETTYKHARHLRIVRDNEAIVPLSTMAELVGPVEPITVHVDVTEPAARRGRSTPKD